MTTENMWLIKHVLLESSQKCWFFFLSLCQYILTSWNNLNKFWMMHVIIIIIEKKICDLLLRENADSIVLSYLGEVYQLVVVKNTLWQCKQSLRKLIHHHIKTKIKTMHITIFSVFFAFFRKLIIWNHQKPENPPSHEVSSCPLYPLK